MTVAATMIELAAILILKAGHTEATELLDEAESMLDTLPGDLRERKASILSNWAQGSLSGGDPGEAAERAREAVDLLRDVHGAPHPSLAATLNTLAIALKQLGRLEEADAAYTELIDVARTLYGEENDKYALFQANQGRLAEARGDLARAEELYRSSIAIFERVVSPDNAYAVSCQQKLAGLLFRRADYAEAAELYEVILPLQREAHTAVHPRTIFSLMNLGSCREGLGELKGARDALSEALEGALAHGRSQTRSATLRAMLAGVQRRLGERDEARALLDHALATLRAQAEKLPHVTTAALYHRALIFDDEERFADAEGRLREGLGLARGTGRDEWASLAAESALGWCLARAGEVDEAERLLLASIEGLERTLGEAHPETLDALARAAQAYELRGLSGRGEELRQVLAERR